jgi:hypothetical protein
MLVNVIKGLMRAQTGAAIAAEDATPIVLNVGGNTKRIPIPDHYAGWRHYLLDIAAGPDVDLVLDARELGKLDGGQFAAIYCSHNLEHYYRHDGARVLAGFRHVLREDGFAEIRVPDMQAVFGAMVERGLEIDDVLYESPAGAITVHDVIYGWGKQIESSGVDFFAHKQGFTRARLLSALRAAGFERTALVGEPGAGFEIRALAFKTEPTAEVLARLRL